MRIKTIEDAQKELAQVLSRAKKNKERLNSLKEKEEKLKRRIRLLAESFPELFETSTDKTVSAGTDDGSVAVTQPDTPITLDYERLRNEMGDTYFHLVFKVTKADMDMETWNNLVDDELVTHSMLEECILIGKKPKARVRFG